MGYIELSLYWGRSSKKRKRKLLNGRRCKLNRKKDGWR